MLNQTQLGFNRPPLRSYDRRPVILPTKPVHLWLQCTSQLQLNMLNLFQFGSD